MSNYAIAVASLGDYRIATMRKVKQLLGDRLRIYAGTVPAEKAIRVATAAQIDMIEVPNIYLPGRILLQPLPPAALLADSLIVDLNPRVLQNWLIVPLRKLLGKRTVLWGHAFPRAGEAAASERVRRAMRSMADGLLTYTATHAEEMRRLHPGKPVFTAPNALYHREMMRFDPSGRHTDVVYVGRLDPAKKPGLLLEAFDLVAGKLPPESRLVFVGDGASAETLRRLAQTSPHAGRIQFLGHVSDYERLKRVYADAAVSVSPGYVGLSITQSFSFGVPMVISRDEKHSPEIEAAAEGENSLFFRTDSAEALGEQILALFADRSAWLAKGPNIVADCARAYSVEAMADGIVAALTARPQ